MNTNPEKEGRLVAHPRDSQGKFIPLTCPMSGCYGRLVYNEHWDRWDCDGLLEPTSFTKPGELEACTYSHQDYDHYEWWMWGENGKAP